MNDEQMNIPEQYLENLDFVTDLESCLASLKQTNPNLTEEELTEMLKNYITIDQDSITINIERSGTKEIAQYTNLEDGVFDRTGIVQQVQLNQDGNPVMHESFSQARIYNNIYTNNIARYKDTQIDSYTIGREIVDNVNFSQLEKLEQKEDSYWDTVENYTRPEAEPMEPADFGDKVLYVSKNTGVGLLAGLAGIPTAGLTEAANQMEEGSRMTDEEMSNSTANYFSRMAMFLTSTTSSLDSMGLEPDFNYFMDRAPVIKEKVNETWNRRDINLFSKVATLYAFLVTETINSTPIKQSIDQAFNEIGHRNPEAAENTMKINDTMTEPIQRARENLATEGENYDGITQTLGEVGQTIGNMAPSIGASIATGNPAIGLGVMGVSAKGQSTQDAINRGTNLEEAVEVGNAKAAVEVGTEMMFGGINALGKGFLDKFVETGILSRIKSEVGTKLAQSGIDIAGEMVEETIAGVLESEIDKGIIDPNTSYTIDEWLNTLKVTGISTIVLNAITGGLAGITNSKSIVINDANQLEGKKFVSLVDNIDNLNQNVDINSLTSKNINGNATYKLNSAPGLVLASQEQKGILYSEYEKVQPADRKYAVYYEPSSTSYTIKPNDILEIQNQVQEYANAGDWEGVKNCIVEYINEKNGRTDIENVICEIDSKNDVEDLHTLFDTISIEEVTEGYAKSFGATYWNYIDEKDSSAFQVPTLMITDKSTMKDPVVLETVSLQKRQNGVDKITGENHMQLNPTEITKLLNSELNLDNVVELLKIRDIFSNNSNIVNVIDEKISGSKLIDGAMHIIENDKIANQIAMILDPDTRTRVTEQIMQKPALQKFLKQARETLTGLPDEYMAIWVEMQESLSRGKFLELEKEQTINNDKSVDAEKIVENNEQKSNNNQKEKTSFWNKIKESKFIQGIKNFPSAISTKISDFWERRKHKALPEAKDINDNNNYQNVSTNEMTQEPKEYRAVNEMTQEPKAQSTVDYQQEARDFRNSMKTQVPKVGAKVFNSIDGAIQQYLMSVVANGKKGNFSPYSALISIAGKIEGGISQRATEVSFLNALRNTKAYNILEQVGSDFKDGNKMENMSVNKDSIFYHIATNAWAKSNKRIDIRLYLNPTRDNMLQLVNQILKYNKNNPLYLKFQSDSQLTEAAAKGKGRNEKIVIYANGGKDGNLGRIVGIFEQIKKENPQLFEGCENINPFLQTVAGVAGVAKEPMNEFYTRLDGKKEKVSKSYNTFLSKALDESVHKVLDDIANSNAIPNFRNFSDIEKIENLLGSSQNVFIKAIKEYLAKCQKNNPDLDIKGIENQQEIQYE